MTEIYERITKALERIAEAQERMVVHMDHAKELAERNVKAHETSLALMERSDRRIAELSGEKTRNDA